MSLHARAGDGGAANNEVVKPALSQAVGYIVVVLIGLIIAFSMLISPHPKQLNIQYSCSHDLCNKAIEADCRGR